MRFDWITFRIGGRTTPRISNTPPTKLFAIGAIGRQKTDRAPAPAFLAISSFRSSRRRSFFSRLIRLASFAILRTCRTLFGDSHFFRGGLTTRFPLGTAFANSLDCRALRHRRGSKLASRVTLGLGPNEPSLVRNLGNRLEGSLPCGRLVGGCVQLGERRRFRKSQSRCHQARAVQPSFRPIGFPARATAT
jgi:hypothetical protein